MKKKSKSNVDDGFMKACAGKVQHHNQLSAQYFLDTLHTKSYADIYKCSYCGFYHIGTSKEKPLVKIKIVKNDDEQHKRKHKRFKY